MVTSMHAATRAAILVPFCASLSACAWLPSFARSDTPLQAAQLRDDPAPHIIPAAFVTSVPVSTVAAVPVKLPKIKGKVVKTPTQRVVAANMAALQEPASDGYVNAIQIYNFSDGALYRLYAAPQFVSDIALQPGETLTAISAGDSTRWVVGDTTSGSEQTKQVHDLAKPFVFCVRPEDQSRHNHRLAQLTS